MCSLLSDDEISPNKVTMPAGFQRLENDLRMGGRYGHRGSIPGLDSDLRIPRPRRVHATAHSVVDPAELFQDFLAVAHPAIDLFRWLTGQ